ncbi:MAG: hypothetical protein KGY99_06765 [Phycisphaerae bacterium]|nr:hypothetical protein [Phycisphaerae bacterium]
MLSIRESLCRAGKLPRTDHVLRERARLLAEEDRDLVEAVLLSGEPVDRVARLKGMTPRAVRHRLHRLGGRMRSKRFRQILRVRRYLAPADAEIATRRYCHGLSLEALAAERGMTLHALRRRLDAIAAQVRLLVDGVNGRRRGA